VLAGRMKLSHFVVIVIVLLGAGIFGLTRACKSTSSNEVPAPSDITPTPSKPMVDPTPAPASATTPSAPTPGTTPSEPAGSGTASDLAARPYDAEVIAWSKRSISGDKMKDATKGKQYKVNLYKDAGMTTVNRAKIDLDRDDKFDEKYTFEPTKITLQRAPADDEKYTETFHWNGNGWTKE
jgi:hypothetical protein